MSRILAEITSKRNFATHYQDNVVDWYDKKIPLFGVEIELENPPRFTEVQSATIAQSYGIVPDNSLMNGVEYVSKIIHNKTLKRFVENTNLILSKKHSVSQRCSTHVHINARDLTLAQIRNWTAVYAIVEDALFSYCAENRKGNNYCYSITQTKPTKSTLKQKQGNIEGLKYCAINSGSLTTTGTLEFRHLQGIDNTKTLLDWLTLLFDVYNYGVNTKKNDLKLKLAELSHTSPYEAFLEEVFGERTRLLKINDMRACLEDNVTWAKLYLY